MFTATTLFQLCRYCIVAILGLVLHLGLIALLVETAGVHYTIAFGVVLPITFVSKFLLDRHWTFRIRNTRPSLPPLPQAWRERSRRWDRLEAKRTETRVRPGET